ncbi:MAG: hypothetical protein QXY34_02415, partial [Candidatus Bathyarchaeia archaeon]
ITSISTESTGNESNEEQNLLSKFTKFTKFTKYQVEVDSEVWEAFKLVSLANGLKVKDAIRIAILDFIMKYKPEKLQVIVEARHRQENADASALQLIVPVKSEPVREDKPVLVRREHKYASMSDQELVELYRKLKFETDDVTEVQFVAYELKKRGIIINERHF